MSEPGTAVFPWRLAMRLRFICRRQACNILGASPATRGGVVRRETQGEWEHFFLATYWNNLDAVIAFAGEDYHVAVTYADDERYQLLSDPYVFQFEVADVVAI